MSNIFYVSKFTGERQTNTLVSLKRRVTVPLSEDSIYSFLMKRRLFLENYKAQFSSAIKKGILVRATEDNIEKYGVNIPGSYDLDYLKDYFIDTTKVNGDDGFIVSSEPFFPELGVELSEKDYATVKTLSCNPFELQVITALLGRTTFQIAVFVKGSFPTNGLYTLS